MMTEGILCPPLKYLHVHTYAHTHTYTYILTLVKPHIPLPFKEERVDIMLSRAKLNLTIIK